MQDFHGKTYHTVHHLRISVSPVDHGWKAETVINNRPVDIWQHPDGDIRGYGGDPLFAAPNSPCVLAMIEAIEERKRGEGLRNAPDWP